MDVTITKQRITKLLPLIAAGVKAMKALLVVTKDGNRRMFPASIETLRYDVTNDDIVYCLNPITGHWYELLRYPDTGTVRDFYNCILQLNRYKANKFEYYVRLEQ